MAYFLARMSQIGYGHGGRKAFWGIWMSWGTIHTYHLTFWAKKKKKGESPQFWKMKHKQPNRKDFSSKFWTKLLKLWCLWKISFPLFFCVTFIGRWTLNSFPPYDLWWPQECGEISDTSVLTFFFISRHYIILISIHFFNNISCVFLSRGHKREWPQRSRLVWQ